MRKSSVVRVFVMASAALTFGMIAQNSSAQKGKGKAKPTPTTTATATAAVVDLDAKPVATGAAQTQAKDLGPPPQAGQMTEEAAQAKRLFDGEKWSEAALALYRVRNGETGDDEGNKQIAQYHLAIALYRLKFYPGALRDLQRDRRQAEPPQVQRDAALAREARDRPAGAGRHHRARRQVQRRADRAVQQPAAAATSSGSSTTCSAATSTATASTRRRSRSSRRSTAEQVLRPGAVLLAASATCSSASRVPAVKSFQRIVGAIDEGVEGVEDEARMRDLAYLSMARTYYSASIKLDDDTNAPTVDQTRSSAPRSSTGTRSTSRASTGSTRSSRSRGRTSWPATTAHALGNIHTIESPYFPNSYYPEADVLKAVIYFANCQYDDATTIVAQFQQKYEPIRDELDEDPRHVQGRRTRRRRSTSS